MLMGLAYVVGTKNPKSTCLENLAIVNTKKKWNR